MTRPQHDQKGTFQPSLDSGIHSQIRGQNSTLRVAYKVSNLAGAQSRGRGHLRCIPTCAFCLHQCSSIVDRLDAQGVVSATCLSVSYRVSCVYLSSHSPPFPTLVVIVMKFIMKLRGRACGRKGGRYRRRELCLTTGAADANNHSFIQTISIAPLQVHVYSEALPTKHGYCAGVSRRSATGNCELRTCSRQWRNQSERATWSTDQQAAESAKS